MKSLKTMTITVISIFSLLSNVYGTDPNYAGDGTVDGTGTVTNLNGVGVAGVEVVFYKCISPTKRVVINKETTKLLPHVGYYDWDLVTDYYDIVVNKNTSNEGGYYNTYCEAGTWPNLVRNIQYGVTSGWSGNCPSEEE